MIKQKFPKLLVLSMLIISLSSCSKSKLQHAQESLIGTWNITQAYHPTPSNNQPQKETGNLGNFQVNAKDISYQLKTHDKSYEDHSTWELTMRKVHSGFVNVPEYTLQLQNGLKFIVTFGDQTSDATKNATRIALQKKEESPTDFPKIILDLEK